MSASRRPQRMLIVQEASATRMYKAIVQWAVLRQSPAGLDCSINAAPRRGWSLLAVQIDWLACRVRRHRHRQRHTHGEDHSIFTARRSCASAVLAVVILSVRLSVCLSVCHTRAVSVWQNQTMYCGYFDTTRKGNHSGFLTPTVVGGRRPLPSEICAQSDPPPSKNADFDRFPLITSRPQEIAEKFNHEE